MRSSLPKVLHPVAGRPMVAWPVHAAREAGAGRVLVIVGPKHDLSAGLPQDTETVIQPEANGTGGAMIAALEAIESSEEVVVLSGDHPLLGADTISALLETHRSEDAKATVMTVELDDPGQYGRIVRDSDGGVERIVETKHPENVDPGDPRLEGDQHRHLPLPRPHLRRRPRPDHQRERGGRVLPRRRPSAHASGRPPHRRPRRDRPQCEPRREQPRRPGAGRGRGPPPHQRGAHARRRDHQGLRVHVDRRRNRDRQGHDGRAGHRASRRHQDRRGLDDRPAHDRHLIDDRREHHRPALPPRRQPPSATAAPSAPSPTFAPARAWPTDRRRALSSRSRTPRSAPERRFPTSHTSATRTSARAQMSAPDRSPRTTTARTSTARRSGKVRELRSTTRWSLRWRSARALTLAPAQ